MSGRDEWSIVAETGAFEEWQEIEDGSSTKIKKGKKKSIDEIIREAEEANKRNL